MSDAIKQLTESLYASLLDNPPWVDFLKLFEQHLPCHYGTMVLRKPRDGDVGLLISTLRNNSAITALQEYGYRNSSFLRLPVGQVCVLSEMLTPEELQHDYRDYYDYMMSFGNVDDLIGIDLQDPSTGMTFGLRGARRNGEPRFGPLEKLLIEELMPHLVTATRLHARIARQELQLNISNIAATKLSFGSMVLSESGQLIIANATAEQIVAQGDGFYLEGRALRCVEREDNDQLQRILRQVQAKDVDFRDTTLKIARKDQQGYWSLLLRPSPAHVGISEKISATVLVLIRDASQIPDVSAEVLMALFGFTRAEAQVAELLVKGSSLDEAALALNRSRYTLRAQLSAIFDKTGIHRQPQLVGHILHTLNTAWL